MTENSTANSGETGSSGKTGGSVKAESAAEVISERRSIVLLGAAVAAGTALGPVPANAATPPNEKLLTQAGDRIQIVKGPQKNLFIKADSLELNAIGVEAFPFDPANNILRRKNRLNRLLVLRLDEQEMDEETLQRSAGGLLVFSALCTHRSCTIQSWMEEERHLRCHCHLSEFAALSGGSVKGGPARRQLPMVPVGLDDEGFVIALEGFTRKPGGAKK